jgi:hypothetical protein
MRGQRLATLPDKRGQFRRRRLRNLLAAEGEKPARQPGGAGARLEDPRKIFPDGRASREVRRAEFSVACGTK